MNITTANLGGSLAGNTVVPAAGQKAAPGALGSLANPAATGGSGENGSFTEVLTSAIGQVNQLQNDAAQKVNNLITGSGEDIHSATLAVERASLAFDLMLQVRNKVVNAYQEISRLQF